MTYLSNKRRGQSMICKSLLKNGYSRFTLEILEYCDPSEAVLREQYYIDLLKPALANKVKEARARITSLEGITIY